MTKFVLLALITFLLTTPAYFSQAQVSLNDMSNNSNDSNSQGVNRATGICANINGLLNQRTSRFNARTSKVTQAQSQRANDLSDNQSRNQAQLSIQRDIWDQNRLNHYFQLRNHAKTDEQLAAVEVFVSTVEQAVKDRRALVDQAIVEYKDKLQNLIDQRNAAVQSAISRYQSSVSVALDAANFDCANDNAVTEVRSTLNTVLKDAQAVLTVNRQSIEGIGSQVTTLVSARKEAINSAIEEFRATYNQAKEVLKLALSSS